MILKELSEAVGVSGKEEAVRKVILSAIKDHTQDIRIDPMGSVTAVKRGTNLRPLRVMIAAHMDEVGFIVRGIDGDGSIRFSAVGGIDDRILPGLRVKIGDIPGVIMWAPIHQNREQTVVKINNLRIDIGASSKDEVNGKVKLGDRIAFDSRFMEIGDKMLRGKSFDDRAGCSLLVDEPMTRFWLRANSGGFATVGRSVPLRPDLAGVQVLAQAFALDPAASLGFGVSAGVLVTLGH